MIQPTIDEMTAQQNRSEMDRLLVQFRDYLVGQKGRSANTVRIYLTDLGPFRRFLERQGIDVRDVSRHDVRRYLAWLSTEGRDGRSGYARVSLARKLVVLKGFYLYLVQAGIVAINPIPKGGSLRIKVEKRLPVFMGKEETCRMLESPDPSTPEGLRDRAMLEVLYSCGLRLSEIATLNLKDLNTGTQEIRVLGKGSKERILLLGKPAVQALSEYLVYGRPVLMSRNRRGTVHQEREALLLNRYGSRLSRRGIEKAVRHYAIKAATRPGVHTHTLRHTFATHLMDGGADLRVVQELLGHASPTTTQVYTHVTQIQARQVYLATHPRAGKGKEDA